MSMTLSGVLVDPLNNTIPDATIRFVGGNPALPYYNPVTDFITDGDGRYHITINYGTYDIYLSTGREYQLIGQSIVFDDNTSGHLPDLLKE